VLFALYALSGCGTSPGPSDPAPVTAVGAVTTRLHVAGMTCGSCADHIRAALLGQPGIVRVDVDVEGGAATVRHDPALVSVDAVAAAITAVGYPASPEAAPLVTAPVSVADAPFGPDPAITKICQAGCAAKFDYDPADVVAQPGAKVGDLTRCPVSGVVFQVQEDQPRYDANGATWFTCCGMCLGKLQESPARFLRM
jgi:copper chaperone